MSQNAVTAGKQGANFIPEYWSELLNKKLEKSGVGMKVINKRYEGEIKKAGDTVHIQTAPAITINPYNPAGTLTYEAPAEATAELIIDQQKYFAFKVDDVSKAQANLNMADMYMNEAKKAIDLVKDSFILGKFADVPLGNLLTPLTITKSNAYLTFVNLAKVLKNNNAIQSNTNEVYETKNKTTEGMPWVIINPDVEAILLQAPEFIQATNAGDRVLRTGSIGSIAGLDVLVATNLPTTTGTVNIMAGINDAITFASQVVKIEKLRDQDSFKDLVRGLYVYGAKTVIPNALAGVVVTI